MNIFKTGKADKEVTLSLDDDDAKDFMEYLKEAQETDLREIERTGCVSQGRDMRNGNVIVMIPSLGLNRLERPEQMFRKMLLLFLLKTHEMVGTSYSIVYAHTAIDIINQYPLIYKFYSILPRFYKKNLQKMYIIHPNIGIRAFFEFARIFLSHKFYNKLCLLESILDFQRVIFPTQLPLPLKFLRKEDEDREVKYVGPTPSVRQSYVNSLGTMEILYICADFLRENQGFKSPGIFRVPGDDGELTLAKVRLQYGYNASDPHNSWVSLSENKKYIVVGNIDDLYVDSGYTGSPSSSTASATEESNNNSNAISNKSINNHRHSKASDTASHSLSAHTSLSFRGLLKPEIVASEAQTASDGSDIAPEIPSCSIVILNNTFTVAELFKFSIRELAEPLVPEELTRDLLTLTRVYGSRPLDLAWEKAVAQRLADLPLANLSTLIFIVRFLREVGAESAHNNMDTKNLSLVFAPTIFRFAMTDLIAATVDIKLIQSVMREIIERYTLLQYTVTFFKEMYTRSRNQSRSNSHSRNRSSDQSPRKQQPEESSATSAMDVIDFNEMEQLMRTNPFFSSLDMVLAVPQEELSTSSNNSPISHINTSATSAATGPSGAKGEQLAEMISSGLSPAMVARMNRAAPGRRSAVVYSDNEDEDNNNSNSSHNHRTGSRNVFDVEEENVPYSNKSDRSAVSSSSSSSSRQPQTPSEQSPNSNNSSNHRHFAVGRNGGGMMHHVMSDRDLTLTSEQFSQINNSNIQHSVDPTMRGRAIPPTPTMRPIPALPTNHDNHQPQQENDSKQDIEEDVSRAAVVLNGQIDRETLRLLEDLQLNSDGVGR